jgi:hypothetical protein
MVFLHRSFAVESRGSGRIHRSTAARSGMDQRFTAAAQAGDESGRGGEAAWCRLTTHETALVWPRAPRARRRQTCSARIGGTTAPRPLPATSPGLAPDRGGGREGHGALSAPGRGFVRSRPRLDLMLRHAVTDESGPLDLTQSLDRQRRPLGHALLPGQRGRVAISSRWVASFVHLGSVDFSSAGRWVSFVRRSARGWSGRLGSRLHLLSRRRVGAGRAAARGSAWVVR